jgi:antitoxin (DNA-binding transcriptional repressor) of toxin-antitoxin stability system
LFAALSHQKLDLCTFLGYDYALYKEDYMYITLSDFRSRMFRLLPKIHDGEEVIITHKKQEYTLLSAERVKKLKLIEGLSNLPSIRMSSNEIRSAIEKGRR